LKGSGLARPPEADKPGAGSTFRVEKQLICDLEPKLNFYDSLSLSGVYHGTVEKKQKLHRS
jgi:hypothetical protein